MWCSGGKARQRIKNEYRRSLTWVVYVNKQVSLQAATAHAAEVSGLKQKLEWAEEELGLVKKQLEDTKVRSNLWVYFEKMDSRPD